MLTFTTAGRAFRAGLASLVVLTLVLSASGGASAESRHSTEDLFDSAVLAEVVADHMQFFWDEAFAISYLPYITPQVILYDSYNYGPTGCGPVESYGYSWYCLADDTVYVSIDQVQDLRVQHGHLFAAVLGVGQPMSLAVLDRVGGLAFDRSGAVDIYSQEAAACLSGVWTAELWWADIIVADDVLATADGLATIGRTLPDAFLFGFDTEDPQSCLDVMLPM